MSAHPSAEDRQIAWCCVVEPIMALGFAAMAWFPELGWGRDMRIVFGVLAAHSAACAVYGWARFYLDTRPLR